jgi:uncharacterized protein YkwD
MRATLLVALAVGGSAAAAAPARYNEPVARAGARSRLVARIESLVDEVARARGREPPRVEPRLERAAGEIAAHVPPSGPPPNELVESALWLHGVVEPPPHLVVLSAGAGGEAAMLDELRAQVARLVESGRFRRVGVAEQPDGEGTRVVLALQESFLDLEPVPRALPSGAAASLRGRLLGPYQHPEAFVTAPDGTVARLPLGGDALCFDGAFRCGRADGRYQLELTGEDRFGPSVVANFPVYCGVPAPSGIRLPPASAHEAPVADAHAAESQIAQRVNADRARAGVAPLAVDAALSQVARAHSLDMRDHHFVGHVSPSTGSVADRTRKAGLDGQLLLENVARAYSPGEAERGLMESPGHRANLLNPQVTRLGVGVALADGGELFVTQVFSRPLDSVDAHTPGELRRRVDVLRRQRGLHALDADAALDRVAADTARELARGALTQDHAGEPAERALGTLADRFRSLRTVVAVGGGLDAALGSMSGALGDAGATAAGVGVAAGRRADKSSAVFVVVVLAAKR